MADRKLEAQAGLYGLDRVQTHAVAELAHGLVDRLLMPVTAEAEHGVDGRHDLIDTIHDLFAP